MSYFTHIRLVNENDQIVDAVDIRELDTKHLLALVLLELKEIKLHLSSMTDQEFSAQDVIES